LPPERPQRLIATMRASSSGLSSVSKAEITVPPPASPGANRAVRVLAMDTFPNSFRPEGNDQSAETQENPAGAGADAKELGLTVWGYLEAVGLDKRKLVGKLTFRAPSGQPLTRKAGKGGVNKPFESRVERTVLPQQAQVLLHFVPYREIGLTPGDHRLIFSYSATCDGLTSTLEEEYVVKVPAGKPDPPSKPEIRRGGSRPKQ
jgi:hypothetical protein